MTNMNLIKRDKKMKKLIYNLVIIVIFLYSCEKEEKFSDFPVTLYENKITHISNVRLFVGKTKISDKETIDKFIKDEEWFQVPNDVEPDYDEIYFYSEDSVKIYTQSFSVRKKDKQFLFYSSRFIQTIGSQDIIRSLMKYTSELLIPIPSPSGDLYATNEVRVGYGSYTNLEMCFVAYKIRKWGGNWYSGAGTFINEFNEEAINTLQPLDTLAIMEYRIKFTAHTE